MDWKCVEYLNSYFEYTKGFLPNSGGWLDQPMKFAQAIKVIDGLVTEHEAERMKEAGSKYGGHKT